jgi:glucokinase
VRSGALLAADIGGTRARLLAADANGGIFARHTMASREFDVSRLTSELALLAGDVKPQAVCVGVAGVVSGYERVVTVAPNLPSIEAVALKPFLEERLDAPVAVEKDVNLAAMGEHTSGAGEGASPMALISLGTGLRRLP